MADWPPDRSRQDDGERPNEAEDGSWFGRPRPPEGQPDLSWPDPRALPRHPAQPTRPVRNDQDRVLPSDGRASRAGPGRIGSGGGRLLPGDERVKRAGAPLGPGGDRLLPGDDRAPRVSASGQPRHDDGHGRGDGSVLPRHGRIMPGNAKAPLPRRTRTGQDHGDPGSGAPSRPAIPGHERLLPGRAPIARQGTTINGGLPGSGPGYGHATPGGPQQDDLSHGTLPDYEHDLADDDLLPDHVPDDVLPLAPSHGATGRVLPDADRIPDEDEDDFRDDEDDEEEEFLSGSVYPGGGTEFVPGRGQFIPATDAGDDAPDQSYPDRPGRPGARSRRRGRPKTRPVQRVAAGISISMAAVVTVTAVVAYWETRNLWDAIQRVPVTGLLGKRPPQLSDAMNVLVFSESSGAGLSAPQIATLHLPGASQHRADTIMVVHIPTNGGEPTVLSFPHALAVPRYLCPSPGPGQPQQTQDLAETQPLNAAFDYGPACLWKTVEQVTHIRIDHFIELRMDGFVKAIDAVGGITMFSPATVSDPITGLSLHTGENHLDGVQALAFWRTGDGIGVGSDLLRIRRDQNLMVAFMHSVSTSGVLGNAGTLFSLIHDIADAMTCDMGLSEADMLNIGMGMKGLSTHQVQFITVPNLPDPGNLAEDSISQPAASQLFSSIARNG
ncbi:MAG TPA: LCP family protein [Streptosporangiaceae bacterium]|nr:LCP family protein [Streptosporangiaceae bacterium]